MHPPDAQPEPTLCNLCMSFILFHTSFQTPLLFMACSQLQEDCRSIAAGYPGASAHFLAPSCHIDVCPASIIRYDLLLYFPWALINRARPPQTLQLEGSVQPAYPNRQLDLVVDSAWVISLKARPCSLAASTHRVSR